MGDEKDAFYVVRKGDVFGVYESINYLQSILRTSVNDASLSVFKGYSFSKEAEDFLSSNGLKSSIYSIDASDLQDDLFGQLITCPFREQNSSKDKSAGKSLVEKRPLEIVGSSFPANPQLKHGKLDNFLQVPAISSYCAYDVPERRALSLYHIFLTFMMGDSITTVCMRSHPVGFFSIAYKFITSAGQPGQAGAGAIIRAADGSMGFRLREGVGIATNNVAE